MTSQGVEINALLDLMKILITPEFSKEKGAENDKASYVFEAALKNSLDAFWHSLKTKNSDYNEIFKENQNKLKHMKYNAESTLHAYLEACLVLFYTLHVTMEEKMTEFKKTETKRLKPTEAPALSPDILSVNQQKIVLSVLQFIVVLGVCPHLQPGIGIPIERRSEFGKLLLDSSELTDMSDQEHVVSLLQTVWVLVTCLGSPSLGQLILSRHLNDILAALLQLVHGKQTQNAKRGKCSKSSRETDNKEDAQVETTKEENTDTCTTSLTPASVVDIITEKGRLDFTRKTEANKLENVSDDQFNESSDGNTEKSKDESTGVSSETQLSRKVDGRQSNCDQCMVDTSFCEESLSDILKKVHPTLLVRELLILQGAPSPSHTKKQSVNRKFVLSQSPTWLRKVCGRMLSDILMGPDGVLNIIKGMLGNVPDDSSFGPPDWRKFDAVAKVVASCPSHIESFEEYYQKISVQILKLLHPKDKQIGRGLLRVACTAISLMAAQNALLAEKYLILPLCRPLIQSTEYHDTNPEKQFIIATEAEIRDCIESLHKVLIGGVEPNSCLSLSLLPVCQPLFELFCFTRKGPSHLSSSSQEVLVSVLKNLDPPLCLSVLKFLLLQESADEATKSMKVVHPNLTFAAGGQGGVVIVTKLESDTTERDSNRVVGAMVDILKPLQPLGITGDFLIFTLQELQRIITHEVSCEEDRGPHRPAPHSADSSQSLLDIEDRQDQDLRSYQQKILVLSVLAQLCEDLGPGCIKNPSQTLKFIQATLERAIQICNQSEDEMTGYFESETLTMAMGLLTAMLSGAVEMTDKDRNEMQILMPLLDTVSSVHTDPSIQEMASDLRIAIATHGVVLSDKLQQKTPKSRGSSDLKKGKSKPLIEELSNEDQPQKTSTKTEKGRDLMKSELEQAMEEICDPLVPVRGHALITMCCLIKHKDPEAMSKQTTLLKIFQENLTHSDSYLYLSAVNGLVAMADIFPDVVIPCLVQEFRGRALETDSDKSERSQKVSAGIKHGAETRMKVGECLVQTSRNLGDLTPKYRDLLLSAFLAGARDTDPLVRASSMSNMGEVCSVLRFNLGNIIQEVFACCSALLKSDSDAEVRKACALTLTLILRGLGKNVVQVLDSVMRDLYHLLKLTLKSERDEGVQRQIVLAYNELEDLMRDLLFPKQVLQKKIRIRAAEF